MSLPALAYCYLFPAMWLLWAAYWLAAARDVRADVRRESRASRFWTVAPLALALALLIVPARRLPLLGERFLPFAPWIFWLGAVIAALGFAFAVWARVHIGRNWSGVVTLKEGHELIESGPYGWVRHPIYAGLLQALIGTALALGEWRGLVALVIVFLALRRKLAIEERWMRERFGEAYADYSRRVAALVPFLI